MSLSQTNCDWPLDTRSSGEYGLQRSRQATDKPLTPNSFSRTKVTKKGQPQPIRLKSKTRSMPHRGLQATFLVRSTHKAPLVEQERLYEDNLSLKRENNSLKQDCSLLKSKLQNLESNINQKSEQSLNKSTFLVHNLQQTIKELRTQVQLKDLELHKLKHSIRSTKIQELEVENQAYIDECTRLRHHLEQLIRKNSGLENECPTIEQKYSEMTTLISNLRAENEALKKNKPRRGSNDCKTREDTLHSADRTLTVRLNQFFKAKRLSIQEFFSKLEVDGEVECGKMSKELGKIGFSVSAIQVEEWCARAAWQSSPLVSTHLLLKTFGETPEEVPKEAFEHLSLRIQLSRVPKTEVLPLLFGKNSKPSKQLTKEMLSSLLLKQPFCLFDHIGTAVDYLLKGSHKLEAVGEKLLNALPDYSCFSVSEEETLDQRLSLVLRLHREEIERECLKIDINNSGTISIADFFSVLKGLGVAIDQELKKYLTLVCYSNSYVLNTVPYAQLLIAFNKNECFDDNDEELLKTYFQSIALTLNEKQLRVIEVFPIDEKGLIRSQEFLVSVETLNIEGLTRESIALLIAALQFQETDEISISVYDLLTTLEQFGLQKELGELTPSADC